MSSSSGRHLPSCSCDSLRRLLEEFLSVFYVFADTDPQVDSLFALENHDFFNEPFVSGSHSPPMRHFEAL